MNAHFHDSTTKPSQQTKTKKKDKDKSGQKQVPVMTTLSTCL